MLGWGNVLLSFLTFGDLGLALHPFCLQHGLERQPCLCPLCSKEYRPPECMRSIEQAAPTYGSSLSTQSKTGESRGNRLTPWQRHELDDEPQLGLAPSRTISHRQCT